MKILGLSAFYHDSACCLLVGGRLVAAASEERFSRLKHDARLPVGAFRYCLAAGGVGVDGLDAVAYYESPVKKLARQLWAGPAAAGDPELAWLDAARPERLIRERLGFEGPLLVFEHHRSHAASAFYYSGFEEAAVLTVDGVGEWATTTYGRGSERGLEIFEEVSFPHSLGLLYSTVTAYLGFRVNDGEAKVMGLAAWGEPRFLPALRRLVAARANGGFELDMRYFDFVRGRRMASPRLERLLGRPARRPGEELTAFHRDVAASLQRLFEEILLEKAEYLARRVGSRSLCLAGGGALNCVANGRLRRQGPFREVFVQPAAGDAGGCLGAAALAHLELTGDRPPRTALTDVYLGPEWRGGELAVLLEATGLAFADHRDDEAGLVEAVADRLARRQVVGWFQGRMEFGPRALGARSLVANPLDPGIADRLNRAIKRREPFRPFAPCVLEERAAEFLDLDRASPFMLETCRVRGGLELPGITHVDGSTRPQTVSAESNPRLAALLGAFERRTGCPMLLNTSFNVAGEPIVCSPADALLCAGAGGLDALVLGDFVLDGGDFPAGWPELLAAWGSGGTRSRAAPAAPGGGLYSFV